MKIGSEEARLIAEAVKGWLDENVKPQMIEILRLQIGEQLPRVLKEMVTAAKQEGAQEIALKLINSISQGK